jgi:hypothetical protein
MFNIVHIVQNMIVIFSLYTKIVTIYSIYISIYTIEKYTLYFPIHYYVVSTYYGGYIQKLY